MERGASTPAGRPNSTAVIELPPPQVGEHVWRGGDFLDPSDWTWTLTKSQSDELLAVAETDSDDLRLLAPALRALRQRLIKGRGFELIRGFRATEVSQAQAEKVFRIIGAHLGNARSQNAAGDLLGHVRNVGANLGDPNVRIYQTNERQTFHTDSCDVVGLMCLETAALGGESMLVSSATIFNEMLSLSPDLAALLFEPIATDRRGEVPSGAKPYFEIPVFNYFAGQLTTIYQRQYIDSAQRFDDAPRLTPQLIQALDLFDEIANDPLVNLHMTLEVGDMQFVHNHSLLHDRTSFVDKPTSPRHLLRLWLAVPGDRELPPVFAQRYGSLTVGDRGGIVAA